MYLKIKQNGISWNANKSVCERGFEVSKYMVQYEGNWRMILAINSY